MIVFSLSVLIITAVVLALIFPALMNKKTAQELDLDEENIQITRDRLNELSSASNGHSSDIKEAELELEATLLDDLKQSEQPNCQTTLSSSWGIMLLVAIPIFSIALYSAFGNTKFINLGEPLLSPTQNSAEAETPSLEELLVQLEEKIEENPSNPDGWRLAANTYMVTGNYEKAEVAYSKLHQLVGETADILTGWADSTIMANSNIYTPDAKQKIDRALVLDPNHINALWIAGLGAQSLGDDSQALIYFHRLLPLVNHDPEAKAQISQIIEESSTDNSSTNAEISNQPNSADSDSGVTLSLSISLAPDLFSEVNDADTVFVVAKAVNGPPMPLAVSRHSVGELPLSVKLDDSMAMLPQMKISNFPEVTVSARISRSGNAITQSGDLVSEGVVVKAEETSGIALTITRKIE